VQTMQVRIMLALVMALCAARPAVPSMSSDQEPSVLRGELESNQAILNGYTVELYDLSRHSTASTSEIRSNGEFEFRDLPYGPYMVTVTNGRGQSVYQGNVTVGGPPGRFIIRLPDETKSGPGAGTISVNQLQHRPARKAFQALRAAQEFAGAGDNDKAVQSIERAIAISPDYADAWVNLAARHIVMGRYEQSIVETRRAIELAGPNAITLCNLAYAQHRTMHDAEAKQSVEEALRLKPDDPHAHYILALILYASHAPIQEVVRHFQIAAPVIPGARTALLAIQGK